MSALNKALANAIKRRQLVQDGQFIQHSVQDVEQIIEDNKIERVNFDGYTPTRNMRRVASIPLVIVEDLMKKGIWGNPERLRKWLNDSDNKAWRTAEGTI